MEREGGGEGGREGGREGGGGRESERREGEGGEGGVERAGRTSEREGEGVHGLPNAEHTNLMCSDSELEHTSRVCMLRLGVGAHQLRRPARLHSLISNKRWAF